MKCTLGKIRTFHFSHLFTIIFHFVCLLVNSSFLGCCNIIPQNSTFITSSTTRACQHAHLCDSSSKITSFQKFSINKSANTSPFFYQSRDLSMEMTALIIPVCKFRQEHAGKSFTGCFMIQWIMFSTKTFYINKLGLNKATQYECDTGLKYSAL